MMDDIYGNLDNYTEETTIAQLQAENKELKLKLEEYASLLDKLQKDLDNMSSAYKKLELNYSSLLKTAKAEIERKTHIITSLNLEKDKMILTSFQNKKASVNKRSPKKKNAGVKWVKKKMNETKSSITTSPQMKNISEQTDSFSKDSIHSLNTDVAHTSTNMATNFTNPALDPSTNKVSGVKENIMQQEENYAHKNRARISNRRKSMPARSMEMESFSLDTDAMTNARMSEEQPMNYVDRRYDHKIDRPWHEDLSKDYLERRNYYNSDRPLCEDLSNDYVDRRYDRNSDRSLCQELSKDYVDRRHDRNSDRLLSQELSKDYVDRRHDRNSDRPLSQELSKDYVDRRHDRNSDRPLSQELSKDYVDRRHDRNSDRPLSQELSKDYVDRRHDRNSDRPLSQELSKDYVDRRHDRNSDRPLSQELSKDYVDRRHDRNSDRPLFENLSKEFVDRRLREDHNSDRPYSRSPSLEDRRSGQRYDNDRIDRFRMTDNSYHRNKRMNSDRHRTRRRGHYDYTLHGSEHDRRKLIETTPMDKYKWNHGYEPRTIYERSYPQENKSLLQSLVQYPIKHKIQHNYDETENKRMKINTEYQRFQDEIEGGVNKYATEQDRQDSLLLPSCESPDYNVSDVSTHQIKEIKLTATTKLDDPRISNEKYVFSKNNGKVALSTAESRKVDIVPVNKAAWGIEPIPEALLRRPSQEAEKTVNKKHAKVETHVVDISMKTCETFDVNRLDSKNRAQEVVKDKNIPKNPLKEMTIKYLDEKGNIETSSLKINSMKIPKIKNTLDNKLSCKDPREIALPVKEVLKKSPQDKIIHDDKQLVVQHGHEIIFGEGNKCDSIVTQNAKKVSLLNTSDLHNKQKDAIAKGVVEGDLELSDDDNERSNHLSKKLIDNLPLQNDKKDSVENLNIDKEIATTPAPEYGVVSAECNKSENVAKETELPAVIASKDTTKDDSKKIKNKKRSKHKENKEENEIKHLTQVSEKTRKKEKVKEDKTKIIKTKFSELFDDSSSLISPEDLGLTPAHTCSTKLPEKCVPIFEDSQNAIDLDTIETVKAPIFNEVSAKEQNIHSSGAIENKTSKDAAVVEKPIISSNDLQSAINTNSTNEQFVVNEEIKKNIYKNLESDIVIRENDVVKTVVISSGIQSQVTFQCEQQAVAIHTEPRRIKTLYQEVALEALATSTPNKLWQTNLIEPETQVNLPDDTISNSTNRKMGSVENASALESSGNNTNSQTEDTVVPDVRIFVRRRRKVIKK